LTLKHNLRTLSKVIIYAETFGDIAKEVAEMVEELQQLRQLRMAQRANKQWQDGFCSAIDEVLGVKQQ